MKDRSLGKTDFPFAQSYPLQTASSSAVGPQVPFLLPMLGPHLTWMCTSLVWHLFFCFNFCFGVFFFPFFFKKKERMSKRTWKWVRRRGRRTWEELGEHKHDQNIWKTFMKLKMYARRKKEKIYFHAHKNDNFTFSLYKSLGKFSWGMTLLAATIYPSRLW